MLDASQRRIRFAPRLCVLTCWSANCVSFSYGKSRSESIGNSMAAVRTSTGALGA